MDRETFEIDYLNMKIINTWNSDGYVLIDPDELFSSHCGNYRGKKKNPEDLHDSGLMDAKHAALTYCIMKIPSLRHLLARRYLHEGNTYLEYSNFVDILKKEGIEVPEEITHDNSSSKLIMFNGKVF